MSGWETTVEQKLVRIDDPILRVPQLAIHLSEDRKGGDAGIRRGTSTESGAWVRSPSRFIGFVAERAGVAAVVGSRLGIDDTRPLRPAQSWGVDKELVSAPRLDNQGHVLCRDTSTFGRG